MFSLTYQHKFKVAEFGTSEIARCIKSFLLDVKYDLAENIISFSSPLPLECQTITKLAIILWQDDKILDRIIDLIINTYTVDKLNLRSNSFSEYYKFESDSFYDIESDILNKLPSLKLPPRLTKHLEERIEKIGVRILQYLFLQYKLVWSIVDKMQESGLVNNNLGSVGALQFCFDKICWTPQGTINKLKTAESLLEMQELSVVEKFVLASNNCIAYKVKEFYKKLPKNFFPINFNNRMSLVWYWTCYSRGELAEFMGKIRIEDNRHEYSDNKNYFIFNWAIKYENEVAMQYFWNNFADEEMRINLGNFLKKLFESRLQTSIDIYVFLMLQINESQINSMCELNSDFLTHTFNPGSFLELFGKILEDWRWRSVILPAAKYLIKNINVMEIENALRILFYWPQCVFDDGKHKRLFLQVINENEGYVKMNFKCIFNKYLESTLTKDMEITECLLSKKLVEDRE